MYGLHSLFQALEYQAFVDFGYLMLFIYFVAMSAVTVNPMKLVTNKPWKSRASCSVNPDRDPFLSSAITVGSFRSMGLAAVTAPLPRGRDVRAPRRQGASHDSRCGAGQTGSLVYLRASRFGMSPWDGPAGSCGAPCASAGSPRHPAAVPRMGGFTLPKPPLPAP